MGVKEIYYAACKRYRQAADDGDRKREWHEVLKGYTDGELWKAWEWWLGNVERTSEGKVMGCFMPHAVELKARIEFWRKQALEERQRQSEAFRPCGENGCEYGWVRSAEIRKGEVRRGVKRCECWRKWRAAAVLRARSEVEA